MSAQKILCTMVRQRLSRARLTSLGYMIAKGTIVLTNLYHISRTGIPDPDAFRPERWLEPDPPIDPQSSVFGFGSLSLEG